MDPELKKLLEENLVLAKQNNEILRSMHSRARWGLVLQILFYTGLFIIPIFLLQPFIGPLMDAMSGSGTEGQQNLIQQYQDLLK